MASITIRRLEEKTKQRLRIRAARNGRSTEAEIRVILKDAVSQSNETGLGTQLAEFGRRYGGIELNYKRDPRPAEPADFS